MHTWSVECFLFLLLSSFSSFLSYFFVCFLCQVEMNELIFLLELNLFFFFFFNRAIFFRLRICISLCLFLVLSSFFFIYLNNLNKYSLEEKYEEQEEEEVGKKVTVLMTIAILMETMVL